MTRNRLWIRLLSPPGAMLTFILWVTPAHATSIVVPGPQGATEGSTNNGFPFFLPSVAVPGQRYQQVFGASSFAAFGGPALITQIVFRPDTLEGSAFSSTLPSLQINLSTTSMVPDGLSSTFASNVGADDLMVYFGALSLSSAYTGQAGGPKAFDIVITLTTPFLYNSASGSLLLDVRNFGGGTATPFDAQNTTGDAVSRVATYGSGVGSATADMNDSFGLVTEFNGAAVNTVPEPASIALLGTGLVGIAARVRRRLAAFEELTP